MHWIAVKFGINTTRVVLEMANFTQLRLVKFISISNTTLVVFIPNFTATHAITGTNPLDLHLINSHALHKVLQLSKRPSHGYTIYVILLAMKQGSK